MSYCITGLEATRVTVVDFMGETLLDEIIHPISDVIDANTKFSGVTLEQIKASKLKLGDVIKSLQEFIDENTILVGHGTTIFIGEK